MASANWTPNVTTSQTKPEIVVLTVVLATVVVILALPLGLYAIWGWGDMAKLDPNCWLALTAVSTLCSLGTLVATAVVLYHKLKDMSSSQERYRASQALEVYADIFRLMMSDEQIEARRWIYRNLPKFKGSFLDLTDDDRRNIKLVLNSLDYVGFLIKNDLHSSETIVDWCRPMVTKVWSKVGVYVEMESERRNDADYYSSARFLAFRCSQGFPPYEFEFLEDAL